MRKREESVRKKGIAVRRNLSKKCEENIRGKFMQSVCISYIYNYDSN